MDLSISEKRRVVYIWVNLPNLVVFYIERRRRSLPHLWVIPFIHLMSTSEYWCSADIIRLCRSKHHLRSAMGISYLGGDEQQKKAPQSWWCRQAWLRPSRWSWCHRQSRRHWKSCSCPSSVRKDLQDRGGSLVLEVVGWSEEERGCVEIVWEVRMKTWEDKDNTLSCSCLGDWEGSTCIGGEKLQEYVVVSKLMQKKIIDIGWVQS